MNASFYRKVKLKPLKERSVLNFHPWIFSGAIATQVKEFIEGEIVEVYDASDSYLATGHFHHGTIMVRILSFKKRPIDTGFWKEKLTEALQMRKSISSIQPSETNTFRLIHGEGDVLPGLVIDIYNKTAVVQAHSKGMQLALAEIAEALKLIDDLALSSVYNKVIESVSKSKDETVSEYLMGSGDDTVVEEHHHKFYVNWKEGQKTGFFIDQRDNRMLLGSYAAGKKVLNTFCYSGGFSIYALKAGATWVDSVDGSAKAIDWSEKNVTLNFPNGAPHKSHTDDAFDFMKNSQTEYDIIILDPPAFAKHLSAVDKATIGYRNLNEIAIRKIKPGGLIFTFSCSQAIDKQLFRKIVFTAAAKTRRPVRVLHQLSQGPDHPINLYHPESEYLKGLVLQVE